MRSNNFFNVLPRDLIRSLLTKWLSVEAPKVWVIEGEPSERQKRLLIAGSGPSLTYDENGAPYYVDANGARLKESFKDDGGADTIPALGFGSKPDLKYYHLIWDYSPEGEKVKIIYSIGFCKRLENGSFAYESKILDEKSPLLRYLREDFEHPHYSRLFPYDPKTKTYAQNSQDLLLLKYMELEIEAAGGLIRPNLQNRIRMARVSSAAYAWMNGRGNTVNGQIFNEPLRQARLETLLHHIAYGEESKAVAVIQSDISLLQSIYKGCVQLCAPEMVCPEISVLDLAIFSGDWFFWRKIVEIINASDLSEKQKQGYKDNFLARLDAVEKYGIEVDFDNLLNKGVQILDADALNEENRERYRNDVVSRNAYHLIIQTFKENEKRSVISCVLGYCDPETKEYQEREISANEELFHVAALELYEGLKNANDGHGTPLAHYFTRSNRDLSLVREILSTMGVKTHEKNKMMKPADFEKLQEYFKIGINGFNNERAKWTNDRLREQWYGEIGAELRLFTAVVWQFWLSDENPWSLSESEVDRFVSSARRPGGDKNYYNDSIFPLSSSFGDRFDGTRGGGPGCAATLARLLKSILKIEVQERKSLRACLQAYPLDIAGQGWTEPSQPSISPIRNLLF
jgi:hypothetical protein